MSDFPIQIPKLGVAMDEGTPLEWLVADSQPVTEGAPLYLIETEKVETEVTAPASGIVYWEVELNEVYPVGARIGRIATDGS